MGMVDQRGSSDDIWTVILGNVSFVYYHASLVPWFFGMDLVRFDYESTCGLRLRII